MPLYYEVLNNKKGKASRYFRRNEGSTDYATIPEVTLSGDFEVKFIALLRTYNSTFLGYSENVNKRAHIKTNLDGTLALFAGNHGTDIISDFTIPLNELTELSIKRVGDVATLSNLSTGESTVFNGFTEGDLAFDWIYNYIFTQNIFSGIIANLKIYDAGTLIRSYAIDDNSDILRNSATTLGAEEIINGSNLVDTTGWTGGSADLSAVGGNLVVTSVAPLTSTRAFQSFTTEVGKTYRLSYLFEKGTAPDSQSLRIGSNSTSSSVLGLFLTASKTDEILFVAETATTFISVGYGVGGMTGVTSIWGNLSIRKADGYGTVINGNASDWGLFQRQDSKEWLGQELIVNGGFETNSDWIKLAGWGIGGGTANGVSTSSIISQNQSSLLTGSVYRLGFEVTDYTSGFVRMGMAVALGETTASAAGVGIYSQDILHASSNDSIGLAGVSSFTGSCDNVSAKEVLNVA